MVGIDLVSPSLESPPPNFQFEIYDMNQGLERFHERFDVVHARMVSAGIKDYKTFVDQAWKCVKPGGVLELVEAVGIHDENTMVRTGPASDKDPEGSWLSRIMQEASAAWTLSGTDISGTRDALEAGLWSLEGADEETCRVGNLFIPAVPWASGLPLALCVLY